MKKASDKPTPISEEDPEVTLQKKLEEWGIEPLYVYLEDSHEDFNEAKFRCRITVEEYFEIGHGNRKKNAKNAAARGMLKMLEKVKFKPVNPLKKKCPSTVDKCGSNIDKFVTSQKDLLSKEEAACKSLIKNPNRAKEGIIRYQVKELEGTKYGGTLVTFWNEVKSPNFKSGDSVKVKGSFGHIFAIVMKVDKTEISVSVLEPDWVFVKGTFGLEILDDVGTFKEMVRALDNIKKINARSVILRDVLFGICAPSPPMHLESNRIEFFNKNLDHIQMAAVEFTLRQKELAVIHGPPGTGKTTTVTEVILQAVSRGQRVLVCGPSNVAADNLLDMVKNGMGRKEDLVRIGHPARVEENLQEFTLEAQTSEICRNVEFTKKELSDVTEELDSGVDGVTGEREELIIRKKNLEKELKLKRKLLEDAEEKVLKRAKVVFGTLACCGVDKSLKHLPRNHFDLTVIDECAQALEASCWIAIPHAPKLLLAGDHLQLPPTIHCKDKKVSEQLSLSLMEKVINRLWYTIGKMLNTQYRMNSLIMDWSSRTFYHGFLYADPSVSNHTLSQTDGVVKTDLTDTVLLLIDTKGCGMKETFSADRASFANLGEAEIVCQLVLQLVASGVSQKDIGVVTTYNLQVELLALNLTEKYPELEIKSVDGFQGREKDVVILSLVRSNKDRNLGFLVERRRLNVAVTRARKQLIMVCDSGTVSGDKTLTKLVEYVKEKGVKKSANQFHFDFHMKLPPTIQEKAVKQIVNKKTLLDLDSKSLDDETRGSSGASSSSSTSDKIAESFSNCSISEGANGIQLATNKPNIGHRFIKEFNSSVNETNGTQQQMLGRGPPVHGGYGAGTMRGGGGYGAGTIRGTMRGGRPGSHDNTGGGGGGDANAMGMGCGLGGYRGAKGTGGRMGGMAVMGKYFLVGGNFIVRMRGLPFRSSEQDIVEWFSSVANPVDVGIYYCDDGRPTGEASVMFGSHQDATSAMTKDKQTMQHRYIELFYSQDGADH